MKNVHFICRGNVYRSRLAEAYATSITINRSDLTFTSSGIEAQRALNGNVDPDTVKLLQSDHLLDYLTPYWHQTTQDDINNSDLVVFMSESLFTQANTMFTLPKGKTVTWNIPDIDGIYPMIKEQVEDLVKTL